MGARPSDPYGDFVDGGRGMAGGAEWRQGAATYRGEGALIGASPALRGLFERIELASRDRYPVWIFGEPGIELDLVARLIHECSPWASGMFSALDVSILPPSLVRREIFGAEAGAIASLPAPHDGALARTPQGTLLLEAIESLPKEIQEELGSALTSTRFRRLGGPTDVQLECRVIASGSRPIDRLAREGRLALSLAERLSTLEIEVPPLRARREDVLLIAARVLVAAREQLERETGQFCPVRGFSPAAQQCLLAYDWPGNDRELREQVGAAVRLARATQIQPEHLLLGWSQTDGVPTFQEAKRAFEREYATRLLRICDGNITQAARLAEKDRKDFYDLMRRNGVDAADYRTY